MGTNRTTQAIKPKGERKMNTSTVVNSTDRYDDGLQKNVSHLAQESRHLDDDEILEQSYGETRRSSVQIRPAPPNGFFNEIKLMELIIWANNLKEAVLLLFLQHSYSET